MCDDRMMFLSFAARAGCTIKKGASLLQGQARFLRFPGGF